MDSVINSFQKIAFERYLDEYCSKVGAILGNEKSQQLVSPENAPHSNQDKYVLAEQWTNCLYASVWNCLQEIGFTPPIIQQLVSKISQDSTITLRLEATHTCKFTKESTRDEESPRQSETTISGGFLAGKVTSKVVTKITEYFYEYSVKYSLLAVVGVGESDADVITIRSRAASQEIISRVKHFPFPGIALTKEELDINPLFSLYDNSGSLLLNFSVNRAHEKCYTPVRNPEVEKVVIFFNKLRSFFSKLSKYFDISMEATRLNEKYAKLADKMVEIPKMAGRIFIPLLPLFRVFPRDDSATLKNSAITNEGRAASDGGENSVTLTDDEISQFLQEQQRSLTEQLMSQREVFSPINDPQNNLISVAEAQLLTVSQHIMSLVTTYVSLIRCLEELIGKQLIAALGREVTAVDFQLYMSFHYRKLFRPEYQPAPFSYAVRRSPLHSPEGAVRIEINTDEARAFPSPASGSNGGFQPIETFCRRSSQSETGEAEMSLAIDASTRIRFRGEVMVHGWLAQAFGRSSTPPIRMVAKARQFSSFIVLLGAISSPTTFEPKFACLLQNQDELSIPLLMETIPNAKQFRDAIESLSPEQQRFAKAYRAMQLESTLFGVVFLQVKPQLEKVLQLKPDSLTKEIALTQDIMKLFIDYQISADLLSFDENNSSTAASAGPDVRISAVKENVKKIMTMLDEAKQAELKEQEKRREYIHGPPPLSRRCLDSDGESELCSSDESIGILAKVSGPPPPPASMPVRMMAMKSLRAAAPSSYSRSAEFASADLVQQSGTLETPRALDRRTSTSSAPVEGKATSASAGVDKAAQSVKSPSRIASDKPNEATPSDSVGESIDREDFTKLPRLLDDAYDRLDVDHAVRPAIIKPGNTWQRSRQRALTLSKEKPKVEYLSSEELNKERNAVFDLLDALTRSGALPIEDASLHIVIGATHSFEETVMNTVVQRNRNPIEAMERSSLIMASTLFGAPSAMALVQAAKVDLLKETAPALMAVEN